MDVGHLGALLGGLLSLLSPCSVMLLPAFFAYAFADPATLVARTGVFYLGLLTTLVPLGVLAGGLGAFLAAHRGALLTAVAVVVLVLGVLQLAGVPLPGVPRTAGGDVGRPWTVYLLGAAYGVAGACTGPILGSVLMLAAAGGSPVQGATMLAAYGAGMAAPLLLLALAWRRWSGPLRRALVPRTLTVGRWQNSWHAVVAGALSVGLGVLLLVLARDPEAPGLLPVATQYRLETGAARLGAAVPDAAVLGVVVLLAAAGFGWATWRRVVRARTSAPGATTPGADER